MYIRNVKADYSACNIGKIEIEPIYRERTLEILSHYSKAISKVQKNAFDKLIAKLEDNNLLLNDRGCDMYFPCLAATPNEALYNAKTQVDTSATSLYEIGGFGVKTLMSGTPVDLPVSFGSANSFKVAAFCSSRHPRREDNSEWVRGALFSSKGGLSWGMSKAGIALSTGQQSGINLLLRDIPNEYNVLTLINSSDNQTSPNISAWINKNKKGIFTEQVELQPEYSTRIGTSVLPPSQYNYSAGCEIGVLLIFEEVSEEEIAIIQDALLVFNDEFCRVIR